MQFSINGWHPVASHLVCMITGIALSNFLGHTSQASAPAKGQLTFLLPAKVFTNPVSTDTARFPVNLYKMVAAGPSCRLFKTGLVVFPQSENFRFSTNLTEQPGLSLLTRELRINNKVKADRHDEKISVCKNRPRITYGS